MNTKFFPELARRLRQEGVITGPAEEKRLPVLLNGQEVMRVEAQGRIVIAAKFADDPEAAQAYETVRSLSGPDWYEKATSSQTISSPSCTAAFTKRWTAAAPLLGTGRIS